MIKMYDVEVLGKHPVIKHTYFGTIIPYEWSVLNGRSILHLLVFCQAALYWLNQEHFEHYFVVEVWDSVSKVATKLLEWQLAIESLSTHLFVSVVLTQFIVVVEESPKIDCCHFGCRLSILGDSVSAILHCFVVHPLVYYWLALVLGYI